MLDRSFPLTGLGSISLQHSRPGAATVEFIADRLSTFGNVSNSGFGGRTSLRSVTSTYWTASISFQPSTRRRLSPKGFRRLESYLNRIFGSRISVARPEICCFQRVARRACAVTIEYKCSRYYGQARSSQRAAPAVESRLF